MNSILSIICLLYTLPGPPSIQVQKGSYFQLYPVNRRLCPKIDQHKDTIFELYTKDNPVTPQILLTNNVSSIRDSNIDFGLDTIIFFHGFLASTLSDDAQVFRKYYLKKGHYNLILVNNERLLAGPDYIVASKNLLPIGKFCGKFVDFLVQMGLKLSKLHIIGMSLGGQLAGITGKYITSGKAARITGLDPAGPLFDDQTEDMRISKDDALFVDIIHTSAGTYGTTKKSGDVDIWVNGGHKQPGCTGKEIAMRGSAQLSEYILCNHYQSHRMYVLSLINDTAYPITKCDNYEDYLSGFCESNDKTYLGINIDQGSSGDYYIKTGITAVDIRPSQ